MAGVSLGTPGLDHNFSTRNPSRSPKYQKTQIVA